MPGDFTLTAQIFRRRPKYVLRMSWGRFYVLRTSMGRSQEILCCMACALAQIDPIIGFPGNRSASHEHNNERRIRRENDVAVSMSYIEQLPLSGRDIAVPAKLPMILKQFCKAAIRTQPYDLLKWSSSYFRALADGEEPPAKSRLEYPPPSTASGLTLGFLRVLLRQFGNYNKTLPLETIAHHWDCLCLDRRDFETITSIGRFRRGCQVKKFLAIAVGLLGGNLTETMIMVCQLFSHEPDGGSAMIPLNLFMEIYEYLAGLPCDGSKKNSCDEEMSTRKDSSIHHTSSINSQDTDADVNLDLESMSKDEVDSYSKTDLSMEPIESSSLEKEEKLDALIGGDRVDKDNAIGERFCGTKDTSNSDGSIFSGAEKAVCRLNVPGIGARLSIEQIASVAAWMIECARLQEGMVGPRNIRHTECPPLHQRLRVDLG